MNSSEYKILLDINEISSQHSLCAKQGDTQRKIIATFTEESELYHISEDCTAVFTALKADGKIIFNEARIEDNTVIYEFTDQTTNVAGMLECELRLYGRDNALITGPRFTVLVLPTVYSDEIESVNEVNVLTGLISEATELIDSVNAKLDSGEFIPQISIGTVATLPAGSNATASISGSGDKPVLNLGIPQGPQGQAESLIPDTELSEDSTKPVQNKVIAAAFKDLSENTENLIDELSENTENALDKKVDKVSGKGLSTNDFTDEEKQKLAGIEEGATKFGLDDGSVTTVKLANEAVTEAKIAPGAVSREYTFTLGTNWLGNEAPYTQTVLVEGLPDSDRIIALHVPSDDEDTAEAEEEALSAIRKLQCTSGAVVAFAKEKTEFPLNFKLLVFHGSGLGSGGNSGSSGSGGNISADGIVLVDRSTGIARTVCVVNGKLTML